MPRFPGRSGCGFSFLACCSMLWAFSSMAAAQSQRLNAPLAPEGDVSSFAHSPDGLWVVYVADQDVDGVSELYSVRADGTCFPDKLNPPGLFSSGLPFLISADSARVVFHGAVLYSVPIDASTPPLQIASGTTRYTISPDGAQVVYLADKNQDFIAEMHTVPIDASAASIELTTLFSMFSSFSDFEVSPNSSRVVFRADRDTGGVFELYSVPFLAGANVIKLNGTLAAGGDVSSFASPFQFSPDGQRVVYHADQDTNDVFELYSVPTDGSTVPVKLNGALVTGGDVQTAAQGGDFRISSDGTRVVYRADQQVDERYEIYSVPLDASAAPVKLNGSMIAGGDVDSSSYTSFRISPDSTRVVYRADQEIDHRYELYSVPIDAIAGPVKLNDPIPVGGSVVAYLYEVSSDNARAVFGIYPGGTGAIEIFSSPIDSGASSEKLNGPLVAGGQVYAFQLSADGATVVYLAEQSTYQVRELHDARISGAGSPRRLVPLAGGADVSSFKINPDSGSVVYLADEAVDEVVELWLHHLMRTPPGGTVLRLR